MPDLFSQTEAPRDEVMRLRRELEEANRLYTPKAQISADSTIAAFFGRRTPGRRFAIPFFR